ncbi:MAG: ankyrin [Sphingomonas bacterium]|nr:ankyrin [Sphingomonas bacterium]
MGRTMRKAMPLLGMIGLLVATPLAAQNFVSDSYSFLKGVRDRDGAKVQKLLDSPSTTIILARDTTTGETALHIVAKRRDLAWLQYMLAKGADMNARDRDGNTALADAAQIGWAEGARQLIEVGATVDLGNNRGETPLILATNSHDLPTVKTLIAGGADPKITDHVAGMSAHDYATRDGRSVAILKALDEAKPVPRKIISGPSIN